MKLGLNCTNGVKLDSKNSPNKVLSLKLNPADDCFHISLPLIPLDGTETKRKILSILVQCFSPLGFLAPIIVNGKLLIQKLLTVKLD